MPYPNPRLHRAMLEAAVDVETLAEAAEVDPKTVRRWLTEGRIPHPRQRARIARLLKARIEFLWPSLDTGGPAGAGAGDQRAEILAAYAQRADVPRAAWWQLFTCAQQHIDLLGYAMHFLPEQHPDFASLLIAKAQLGCQIRIAVGDPAARPIRERDSEEGLGGTLPDRIRATLNQFAALWDCPGIDIRVQAAPLYNSVFRCDDEMFVTPHLYGLHGSLAPLLHLRRLGQNGVFERFAGHFEAIWAVARPAEPPRPRAAPARSSSGGGGGTATRRAGRSS